MVSVIIIGFNSRAYLESCLHSLGEQTAAVGEILFVDNDSADGSVTFVERTFPEVEVIGSRTNLGYARSANIGIERARGDMVLILNPDMILGPEYLAYGLECLKRHPQAAGVTGKVYKFEFTSGTRTNIIDSVGLVALRSRRFLDRGAGLEDRGQFDVEEEVFGISGNCMLLRRTALEDAKIGGEIFDEDFFTYKEDVDLCWRLRLFGWTFVYDPRAVAFHGRGTGVTNRVGVVGALRARQRLNRVQQYYSFKNHRLMQIKNEEFTTFLRDAPGILTREFATLLWITLFEPRTVASARELVSQLPAMVRKRRQIMKRRHPHREALRRLLAAKAY